MDLQIKDLNILIGPNNSGKTSVLQTLALLKQSIDQLRFNGPLVNLGDFKDAVHNHRNREAISISLRVSGPLLREYLDCFTLIKGDERGEPFVAASGIGSAKQPEIIDFEKDREKSIILKFNQVGFSTEGFIPKAAGGSMDQINEYKQTYNSITEELSRFLYYLSARRGTYTRSEPVDERYSHKPDDVGLFGENTIPVLAHIQHDEEYAEAMQKIHFWLEKFGLTKSVARIVEGEKPSYSLKVENEKTRVASKILDVGFGVNQLFPVLVQCFYAPKGSLIMIEQPEAHLHPKSQAEVADFLIDVVNYGNRVLVETHSEHLLLRLQRRIAEKKIKPEVVNVCYFEQTSEGTKTSNLKMDENGYFTGPIPKGFFEEGFEEAIAHLRASRPQGDIIEPKQ